MYKPLSKHTIDLLDRKFQFLMESQTETFMLDLQKFVEFLFNNEIVADFTKKLYSEVADEYKNYCLVLEHEKVSIVKFMQELLTSYPELSKLSGTLADDYNLTNFENILNGRKDANSFSFPIFKDILSDNTDVGKLVSFLVGFENDYRSTNIGWKLKDELLVKLKNIENLRKYNHLNWANYLRVSPSNSLNEILVFINEINPIPKDHQEWMSLSPLEKFQQPMVKKTKWVKDITFGVVSEFDENKPANLSKEQINAQIDKLKSGVKRIYEAIREEIGTNLLYFQLINRYKVRSQIYNKPELRKIVEDKNNAERFEDVLTLDLARFLFDSGLSTYYRVHAGSHEYDLIDLETNTANPLFVEAKVYTNSKAKQTLIKGIYQLHSYLCGFEAKKLIDEAYYVVFRIGGPIYVFPHKIQIGKFSIYPILIDLGVSEDSGRKQPKPIEITLQKILDFKYEPETENNLSGKP